MVKRGNELAKMFIKFSHDQLMVDSIMKDFHENLNFDEQNQFLSFISGYITARK